MKLLISEETISEETISEDKCGKTIPRSSNTGYEHTPAMHSSQWIPISCGVAFTVPTECTHVRIFEQFIFSLSWVDNCKIYYNTFSMYSRS